MITDAVQSAIRAIERDAALYDEPNFSARLEAIDDLEFHVIDRIDGALQALGPAEELLALKRRAEDVKRQLEAVDERLFRRLRADIRSGALRGAALAALIDRHVGRDANARRRPDEPGYDSLDAFVNGLLLTQALPTEIAASDPEMVPYQQTPARIILELVERAALAGDDIFYDLGSGLGHVPILVNLLSGAPARGVEIDPALCDYARARATELGLPGVTFIRADARAADYSEGTVFFMYTPFRGAMLEAALEKLRRDTRGRAIRLFSYGPCTQQVAQQSWLQSADLGWDNVNRLCAFRSA
ncbi:MAG: class I SAM-dependent methyltransferase [Chloroflexota bacterium]|nr:MAG: hypothetical protein DIU80_00270 [Chloroflexota bacterium]